MHRPEQSYQQAVAAFHQQDWPRVLAQLAPILPLAARHAGVHYLAGVAHLEQHSLPLAIRHLQHATSLEPANADFAACHALALALARQPGAAKAEADRAMALAPGDATVLNRLGSAYAECAAHAAAADAYARATTLAPADAALHFNLATALISTGDNAGAERAIETCLALEPRFWRAHLALANLHRQTPEAAHVQRLQTLLTEQHDGDTEARLCLHFALAKEHEDLGHYQQAFEHYRAGNAAGREEISYDPAQDEAIFAAMTQAFPEPLPPPDPDTAQAEPIFVFGLPRSGTTLVARTLTSHPQVQAAGELLNFPMAVGRAWGRSVPFWRDPELVARVHEIDWARAGEGYIASTRPATGQMPRFVDKFPFNFLYAGFIARALPNARMICLRRAPLDTCLGNFRQTFVGKLPYYHYSFDLGDIARYYILFDRLMAHWRRVLPGRLLELSYETLVDTQETETRRLLDHCNLPWHPACLHFERNAAPVATASSLQVRQPLFRSSIGHWRHYETELTPLRAQLREAGIPVET